VVQVALAQVFAPPAAVFAAWLGFARVDLAQAGVVCDAVPETLPAAGATPADC